MVCLFCTLWKTWSCCCGYDGGHGNYAAEVARDVLTQYFGMNESTEVNESMTATPFVEQIR